MNINATLFLQAIVFAILVWFTMRYIWPPLTKALQALRAPSGARSRIRVTSAPRRQFGSMAFATAR